MIIRTIIILILLRICITLMTVLTGNTPDLYVEIPGWLGVLLFYPFKTTAYQVYGIPLQIGWYAVVMLFITEWVFNLNLNTIICGTSILTMISTVVVGLWFVIKRREF